MASPKGRYQIVRTRKRRQGWTKWRSKTDGVLGGHAARPPSRQSGRGLPAASSWGAATPLSDWGGGSTSSSFTPASLSSWSTDSLRGGWSGQRWRTASGWGLLRREGSRAPSWCSGVFTGRRRGEKRFKPCGQERRETHCLLRTKCIGGTGGLREGDSSWRAEEGVRGVTSLDSPRDLLVV